MIRKLAEQGLVTHTPYKHVELTDCGRTLALEMVRHHRLLETYLAVSLDMPWDRVHAEAEVLEHVISEELEARIAAKLGHPTHDPHGDPIPSADLQLAADDTRALASLEPGDHGTLARVADDPEMLRYLSARGIAPGAELDGGRQAAVRRPAVRAHRRRDARPRRRARRLDAGARGVNPPPSLLDAARAADAAPPPQTPLEKARSKGRVAGVLALFGPAFVAAVAYIDPGNFATNIAGGAKYGYMLVWVIVAANLMAMLVQYLSAKTGIATGKNLPGALPRALQEAGHVRPLAAGGGDRDRDRPRRVRRRGDRAQPPLRRPAVRRRPDDRGRRVRDPRAADARLPQVRAGDRRLPDDRVLRLHVRPQPGRRGRARAWRAA